MSRAMLFAKIQWIFNWKKYKMYIKMMSNERIFVQYWPFVHPIATWVKYASCSTAQKVFQIFCEYTQRIYVATGIEQHMMMSWHYPHKKSIIHRSLMQNRHSSRENIHSLIALSCSKSLYCFRFRFSDVVYAFICGLKKELCSWLRPKNNQWKII